MATETIMNDEAILAAVRVLAPEATWVGTKWIDTYRGEPDMVLMKATALVDRGANMLGSMVCTGWGWHCPAGRADAFRALAEAIGVTDLREEKPSYFTWGPGAKLGMVTTTVG